MGASISTTFSTNPPNSPILQNSFSMSSPSSSSPDPKTLDSEPKTLETQTSTQPNNPPSMDAAENPEKEKLEDEKEQSEVPREDQGEEEEEEEGECGFCLFMKGGGCRDTFIAWEDCIKEAEDQKDDIVERCAQVTGTLRKCMEAHKDYYAPLLQAEKDMEEQAKKELQEEEEAKNVTEGSERAKNELQVEEEAKNVTERSEQPKNELQQEEEAKNVASGN